MISAGNTFFFPWEVSFMVSLQAGLSEALTGILSFLSVFGEEIFLILVIGALYWGIDKALGRRVGLSVLIVNVWFPMIKNTALRRRPYMDHEDIRILRLVDPSAGAEDIAAQGYSFPSGHSGNAAALFTSLAAAFKKKKLAVPAVVMCLLVGFSRVAMGAHYPTDVLAGWIIGAAVALLIPFLERKIRSRPLFCALILLTGVPGLFYCRSTDYFSGFGLLIGFIAGTALEEKAVRFENTRSVMRILLRTASGIAVFLVLNKALKLPFDKAWLEQNSLGSLVVRCARYAVISFVGFGVYPMLFTWTDRFFQWEMAK